MLLSTWKPANSGGLVRIGPSGDGGYVLSRRALAATQRLISMGLNDDWRFEEAFINATGKPFVVFDGTVDRIFWRMYAARMMAHLRPWRAAKYLSYRRFFSRKGAEHRIEMIGYDNGSSISLTTILEQYKEADLLLKIDIEGWEMRILDQIVSNKDRFTGVVMELHDIDLHRDRIDRFLGSMTNFDLVNITANNYGGVDDRGDPLVIEISLMRSDLVDPPSVANATPLGGLNNPRAAPIELRFAD